MIKQAISALPLAHFGLMCMGLMMSSYFLYLDKLTGAEWVAMCGILFTTERTAATVGAFKREQ